MKRRVWEDCLDVEHGLNMARLRETGVWFRLGADGSFMDEVYAHFEIGSGGDSYGSCGSKMGSFVSLKVQIWAVVSTLSIAFEACSERIALGGELCLARYV
jgi:hypothetical protein